jgi:hypothetical protein
MSGLIQIIGTKLFGIEFERSHEIETYDNIKRKIDFTIIKTFNPYDYFEIKSHISSYFTIDNTSHIQIASI